MRDLRFINESCYNLQFPIVQLRMLQIFLILLLNLSTLDIIILFHLSLERFYGNSEQPNSFLSHINSNVHKYVYRIHFRILYFCLNKKTVKKCKLLQISLAKWIVKMLLKCASKYSSYSMIGIALKSNNNYELHSFHKHEIDFTRI